MINNVSFMSGKDQIAKKAPEYFNPRNPIGKIEEVAKKAEEKAEEAISSYVESHAPIITTPEVSGDKIAEAYKAAHGIVG